MARRDARITAYIGDCRPFARPILKRLRATIHQGGPVEETLKWGMPTFMYRDKIVCGIAGFKAHCALWFKNGKAVVGRGKRGDGMGHFGRITSARELPSTPKLKAYVKKAMRLIDERIGRRERI
jgi:hypothetical protein